MNNSQNFTAGKPAPAIIKFCIPVMLGLLLQQFYSIVDTIIVGQFLGVKALAGIGATGSFSFFLTGFAAGLTTGFSLPISQSLGANDMKALKKYTYNSFYLCIGISAILSLFIYYFCKDILVLMDTPNNVLEYSYNYASIILTGIGFTIFYNYGNCIFRALGDSKSPLIFLLISSILNIALDFIFIAILNMEVEGAALATVIATAISAISCLIYLFYKYPFLKPNKEDLAFELAKCKKLLATGMPMALQFSVTAIGNIVLQTAINKLGSDTIAAVSLAQKVQMIVVGPLEGIGITMATYVSQNFGGEKFRRIKNGMFQSNIITAVYCIFSMVIIIMFKEPLTRMFVSDASNNVLSMVYEYLMINVFFYYALGMIFSYRNALQSIGYSIVPMLGGILELIIRSILTFGLVDKLGYDIICWAAPIAWVFAAGFLMLVYSNKFKLICKRAYEAHHQQKKTTNKSTFVA